MAIASSTSANSYLFAGSSALAGLSAPTGLLAPANVFAPADFLLLAGLVLSPYTGLPGIQDINKPFFIRKLVTAVNNTTAQIYTKGIIWIGGVPFVSLDKAWQYMLGIPNDEQ